MRVFQTTYRDRQGKVKRAKRWYLDFSDHRGVRRRIPGFEDKRQTESLGRRIESLIACQGGPLSRSLISWLEGTPVRLRNKLASVGLLDPQRAEVSKPLSEARRGLQGIPGSRW